ncbi:MAG: glycosyltransferase family 4 protein [Desulfobacterales bacterium]|nr:glycosyltransferase family 4 protein [Desulfobacterales bacterium]
MKTAILDPSLFCPLYDINLIQALAQTGEDSPMLFCRRPRRGEVDIKAHVPARYLFYPITDGLPHSRIKSGLKGVEHLICMVWLCIQLVVGGYQILHIQWAVLPLVDNLFFRLLKWMGIRLIFTAHNDNPFHGAGTSSLQARGWAATLDIVHKIQVHTRKTQASLEARGIAPERICRIPHGYLDTRAPAPASPRLLAEIDQLSRKRDLLILFFGQIKPYKGLDILARELNALAPEEQNRIGLMVAGKVHPDARPHAQAVDQLPMERLCRYQYVDEADLAALIDAAHVVVFPYRDIDASGALLYAMGRGKACITSRVAGFLEILKDRENGRTFDIQSPGALAEIISEMLLTPGIARDLGRAADRFVKEHYDWAPIGRALNQEYIKMLTLQK